MTNDEDEAGEMKGREGDEKNKRRMARTRIRRGRGDDSQGKKGAGGPEGRIS